MAVAVKNTPEAGPRGPFSNLHVASLLGVVYVLVSLAIVFSMIPTAWQSQIADRLIPAAGAFVNGALLILVTLAAAVGLFILGLRLLGPQPLPGLRAGIVVGLVGIIIIALITKWASLWFEHWTYHSHWFGDSGRLAGILLTAAVGVVLLVLAGRFFLRPSFEAFLVGMEEQGWFSATSYKRNQGQKVRRGTILGILILTGAGIFTLVSSRRLESGPANWELALPFTGQVELERANDAWMVLKEHSYDPKEGLVLDRYAFRDMNEELAANYVKIVEPGYDYEFNKEGEWVPKQEALFNKGQVVKKEAFDAVLAKQQERIREREAEYRRLKADNNPTADTELERAGLLRSGLPQSGEPTPAAGKTTFATLTLLPAVRFTLPLLLAAGAIWLAWRMVNLPVFADFLIATEAEMNKVSWSTRRRLVQDTIVVLTTVVLLTFFLLFADIVWSQLLKAIEVLRSSESPTDPAGQVQKQRPW